MRDADQIILKMTEAPRRPDPAAVFQAERKHMVGVLVFKTGNAVPNRESNPASCASCRRCVPSKPERFPASRLVRMARMIIYRIASYQKGIPCPGSVLHCFAIYLSTIRAGPNRTSITRLAEAAWRCMSGFSYTDLSTDARSPGGRCDRNRDDFAAARGSRTSERGFSAATCRAECESVADDAWKGWWGDTPPYHTPVYVLTHHPRPS